MRESASTRPDSDGDTGELRRRSLLEGLHEYAATQNELGRLFARQHGMHPTDAAAVVEILDAERQGRPLTPVRLAERLMLTTGATSTLLNRLENAGHIVRTRQNSDRRIVTIRSTPAVHRVAEAFFAPLAQHLDAVLADHSTEELVLVEKLVEQLRLTAAAYLDTVEPTRSRPRISPERDNDR